jgi:hypothetical protein
VSESERFRIDEGESLLSIEWGFVLVFHRKDDRWIHVILESSPPSGPRPLIGGSHEWDADRDGPERMVSPVFQELQLHRDPQGTPHVLLLGMAGAHHFSADFLCEGRDGVSRLSVDVAARCRSAGGSYHASTYNTVLDPGQLAACDESSIAWDRGERRLVLAAGPATRLAMAEAGRRGPRVQAFPEIGVVGATRRWRYSWSLSPHQA